MAARLERCWCGGIAELAKDGKGDFVRCTHCGNYDFIRHGTADAAAESWNDEMRNLRKN